jgi:hypothetical protein
MSLISRRRGSVPESAASILAELRRRRRHAERRIDVRFGGRSDALVRADLEDAVLGDLEPPGLRDLAKVHVVLCRTGEVLECRSPDVRRHDPDVDLETCRRQNARLGVAACHHVCDHGHRSDRVHHDVCMLRRDEHVDVADRLLAATNASGGFRRDDPALHEKMCDDPLGQRQRVGEQHP